MLKEGIFHIWLDFFLAIPDLISLPSIVCQRDSFDLKSIVLTTLSLYIYIHPFKRIKNIRFPFPARFHRSHGAVYKLHCPFSFSQWMFCYHFIFRWTHTKWFHICMSGFFSRIPYSHQWLVLHTLKFVCVCVCVHALGLLLYAHVFFFSLPIFSVHFIYIIFVFFVGSFVENCCLVSRLYGSMHSTVNTITKTEHPYHWKNE